MPRSRTIRSPKATAVRKERRVVFNAPFADAFLSGWVDAQLGPSEWRATIELIVAATASSTPGELLAGVTHAVAQAGGEVVADGRGGDGHQWVVAAWGSERSVAADPSRALDAAFAIAQGLGGSGRGQCLLDARLRCLPKAEGGSGPATIDWMASLPPDGPAARWMPRGVIISEMFRRISGLEKGLVALSTGEAGDHGAGAVWYGLLSPAHCMIGANVLPAGEAEASERDQPSPQFMRHLNRIDGLGDLKPVLIAAAVAGTTFTTPLLARMLDLDEARLMTALECAAARGLVSSLRARPASSAGGEDTYAFSDEGLRAAAYRMVPEGDRHRLHRKAAAALSDGGRGGTLGPEAVADHHRRATNPVQSKRWLSRAACAAIARGESAQAVHYLEMALSEVPADRQQAPPHRLLLQLLGVQLAVAKGNSADEVYALYTRSLEAVSDARRGVAGGAEFRALWGLQSYHLVRGEVQAALTIGQIIKARFAESGSWGTTSSFKILANRMQGLAVMLNGQLADALVRYDAVLAAYEPARDAALRFAYGSDQAALALAHRAWIWVLMGRAREAQQDARKARKQAELLAHSHTSAHVLGVLSQAALAAGALAEAALTAREARAIATENGHPYWIAWSDVVLAAADTGGPATKRLEALADAITTYEAQNARQLLPAAYACMARAAIATGALDIAGRACERGLEIAGSGGAIVHRPTLHLARAQVLKAAGDPAGADQSREAAYVEALGFGALGEVRQITLDGFKSATGRPQITWQRRYHQVL